MADLLDVLTLAEGKRAVSMASTNTEHEDKLKLFITGVSRRIDELVGPVVVRTVTEYHDGGTSKIRPRQTPVSSITTVKHWDGTTTTTYTADAWGSAANTDGYQLKQSGSYPHDAVVIARSSGTAVNFPSGSDAVQLVYVAGRAATTADVDERYKFVAGEILLRAWKPSSAAWSQTPDFLQNVDAEITSVSRNPHIQAVIRDWLGDELKPPGIA